MTITPLEMESTSYTTAEPLDVVEVIETVISSLEQDESAMVSHGDEGHLWKFNYGTVEVFVQLSGTQETDTLTVWSAVLSLPAKDELALMRHLLEMNCGETLEASYGILNDSVVVLSSRTLEGITAAEISRVMTIVATIADENDGPLQEKFGATA